MAIYAIGDLQGCYEDLTNLLEKINFDQHTDKLWLVGDLVNRGPDSLATLRFVKNLGNAAQTVLGNHDLHLLAMYHGLKKNKDSSIQQILDAPDCEELMNWLRSQPLLFHDKQNHFTMVHAGLYPLWNLQQAQQYAAELESVLSGDDYLDFLNNMYGDKPNLWKETLTGWDRLRFICNTFTRMRYCKLNGKLNFSENGVPGSTKNNLVPWFELNNHKDEKIVFGHWSTLGYFQEKNELSLPPNIYALDTGCVWGGKLTALKITKTAQLISINCPKRASST